MTYPEQLQTTQWKNKRDEILERDNFACQKCNNFRILAQTKKGTLNGHRFYAEQDKIDYINVVVNSQFSVLNPKQTIFYGISKNATIYIIGARHKTPSEIELENYEEELKKLFNSNLALFLDQQLSMKDRLMEIRKKIYSEGFENLVWIRFSGLHIHHKYYIKEQKAWEYNSDALITLCETCHDDLHNNQEIPVYNPSLELLDYYKFCLRCNGKGVFPEYSHVQSGICFRCHGNRYEELIIIDGTS